MSHIYRTTNNTHITALLQVVYKPVQQNPPLRERVLFLNLGGHLNALTI
jgi:hypothetical protein